MRYNEIINELFDAKANWDQVEANDYHYKYLFTVNTLKYQVDCYWDYETEIWDITFRKTQGLSFNLSGDGNASIVLATVIDIIRAFLATVNPKYFEFGAAKQEASRVSLYRRLSKVLSPQIPYTYEEFDQMIEVVFKFTNNNVPATSSEDQL